MKILIVILISLVLNIVGLVYGENSKNQFIDLGALSVDGQIITPGDLSVDDEEEKTRIDLYKRRKYRDQTRENIESLL